MDFIDCGGRVDATRSDTELTKMAAAPPDLSVTGVCTDHFFNLTEELLLQTRQLVVDYVKALKKSQGREFKDVLFARVDPVDPLKQELASEDGIRAHQHHVLACILDKEDRQVYEVKVNVSNNTVANYKHVPGVRPNIMFEEFMEFEEVCKASPEVQKALRARGITDFKPELLQVDPISSGTFGHRDEVGKRLATGFCWYLDHILDNGYAHPVPGLGITVDLDEMKIFRITDFDPEGKIPIPRTDPAHYDGTLHQWYSPLLQSQPKMTPAKPLDIVQKEGPSFELSGATGRHMHWLEWDFDIGFTYREGLTLHNIKYRDPTTAQQRSICYRAAVSEMAVPYASPAWYRHRQNPIDSGASKVVSPFDV